MYVYKRGVPVRFQVYEVHDITRPSVPIGSNWGNFQGAIDLLPATLAIGRCPSRLLDYVVLHHHLHHGFCAQIAKS